MSKKGDEQRAATESRLWKLFDQIKADGKPTGPTAFAEAAGIDRTYLYTFNVLAAELSAYGKKTQPHISRRGAGVKKTQAIKRDIAEQVRREHTQWSSEIVELRRQRENDKERIAALELSEKSLGDELRLFKRAYELLLLLASERGVSPSELEEIQGKLFPALRAAG
jgi:hypothetical protein